jgi:hypothetical protein
MQSGLCKQWVRLGADKLQQLTVKEGNAALFELELELPDKLLTDLAGRLVGFHARFARLRQDLRLLVDRDGLEQSSKKHYGKRLPLLDSLHGDVGTGKTATAEAAANALTKEMHKEAIPFKLSTRVRGGGNVGEMSMLINQAFDLVSHEAGRARLAYRADDPYEWSMLMRLRSSNQLTSAGTSKQL